MQNLLTNKNKQTTNKNHPEKISKGNTNPKEGSIKNAGSHLLYIAASVSMCKKKATVKSD